MRAMSHLDTGQLAALYDLAGPQMGGLLDEFVRTSRDSLARLAGLAVGEEAVELVHQLKGASATMGMRALEEGAGELEDRLRAGGVVGPGELSVLGALLEDSVREVRGILASGEC